MLGDLQGCNQRRPQPMLPWWKLRANFWWRQETTGLWGQHHGHCRRQTAGGGKRPVFEGQHRRHCRRRALVQWRRRPRHGTIWAVGRCVEAWQWRQQQQRCNSKYKGLRIWSLRISSGKVCHQMKFWMRWWDKLAAWDGYCWGPSALHYWYKGRDFSAQNLKK